MSINFCERNVRAWVGALAVSAVAVLIYAVWSGSGHKERQAAKAAATAPMVASAAAPTPVIAPTPVVAPPVPQVAPSMVTTVPVVAPVPAAAAAGPSFTNAVDRVRPSVVNINAVRSRVFPRAVAQTNPTFIDPFDGVPDKLIGNQAFESGIFVLSYSGYNGNRGPYDCGIHSY